ncbi:hypothetical protein CEXT_756181 [Caerostris extrusa]|uniref:Ycf1 n=1 Tax=Caerostris extrusa TaxID=172846 RepID=A0AAV4RPQ2_CAEEX|nr:hypothetical protein CEXT_756181 [Caerostris extrusa]
MDFCSTFVFHCPPDSETSRSTHLRCTAQFLLPSFLENFQKRKKRNLLPADQIKGTNMGNIEQDSRITNMFPKDSKNNLNKNMLKVQSIFDLPF